MTPVYLNGKIVGDFEIRVTDLKEVGDHDYWYGRVNHDGQSILVSRVDSGNWNWDPRWDPPSSIPKETEVLLLLSENNYSKMVDYAIEKGIIEKNGYDEWLAPSMVMQRLAKYALGAD